MVLLAERRLEADRQGAVGLEPDSVTSYAATDSRRSGNPGAAKCAAVGAHSGDFDPESVDAELAVVVAAWPGLSADERAAVLALVRRAVGDAGGAVGD